MKKMKLIRFLLCLTLVLQCILPQAYATEATEPTTVPAQPSEASTEPVTLPQVDQSAGNATITYGCRTINGQTPLGGTDRILETAQAAFVYEVNTRTVIYSYNPDTELYPGSLAKIMTALLAIEEADLDDQVIASTQWNKSLPAQAVDSGLKEGEELTLRDLLHCLILESGNDAALNIANFVAGDQAGFVDMMNERAKEMGCTNTVFVNCHGLDAAGQHTTARDIAKITLEASRNPKFRELFGTTSYTIPANNRSEEPRTVVSGNHLIYDRILPQFSQDTVTGGMPSYTSEASGASLACTAEDEDKGMSLVIVVMGCKRTFNKRGLASYYGNFEEVLDLLDLAFEKYKINQVFYPGMALEQFPVVGGDCSVVGQPNIATEVVLPADAHLKNLIFRYNLDKDTAPIQAEERIGTVQIWYQTSCVAETDMYAMNPVHTSANSGLTIQGSSRDDSSLSGFIKYFLIICLVVFIALALYLVINNARRAAARAKRRRRRASRRRSR